MTTARHIQSTENRVLCNALWSEFFKLLKSSQRFGKFVFEKHPEYIEENILARITEPERD